MAVPVAGTEFYHMYWVAICNGTVLWSVHGDGQQAMLIPKNLIQYTRDTKRAKDELNHWYFDP